MGEQATTPTLDPVEVLRQLKQRQAELAQTQPDAPAGGEAPTSATQTRSESKAAPAAPASAMVASAEITEAAALDSAEIAEKTDADEIKRLVDDIARQLREGSLLRTYRYLRVVMIATVPAIAVGIIWAWANGFPRLPSISHYYYTPARIVFVCALVAAAAALLALSGRGAQRGLLDIAALFAPLIALIPTAIGNDEVPGLTEECAEGTPCIPEEALAYVAAGIICWAVFSGIVLIFAIAIAVQEQSQNRRWFGVRLTRKGQLGVWLPILFCAAVLVGFSIAWMVDDAWFLSWAHVVSASTFFVIIMIVALIQVRRESIERLRRDWRKLPFGQRIGYLTVRELRWLPRIVTTLRGWIALLFLLDIGAALWVLVESEAWTAAFAGFPIQPVFLVEAIGLVLFSAFWISETQRMWNNADPE